MNKTKLPSLIPILILTLITVVMWVAFDVYRSFVKTADSPVPANISQSLTPSLDAEAIKQIESRSYLNGSEIPDTVISSSPVPVVTTAPSPTASPTIEPSGTPVSATESATTQ